MQRCTQHDRWREDRDKQGRHDVVEDRAQEQTGFLEGGSGCIFLTQRISALTTEVSKQTNGCVVSIFFPFEQRLVFSARLDQTGVSQTHILGVLFGCLVRVQLMLVLHHVDSKNSLSQML